MRVRDVPKLLPMASGAVVTVTVEDGGLDGGRFAVALGVERAGERRMAGGEGHRWLRVRKRTAPGVRSLLVREEVRHRKWRE